MTGKDAIISKILEDARKIANSTLEEGLAKASEIIAQAENDTHLYKEKNMQASYIEREDILRRRQTVANLEVKKIQLGARQQIITKAFVDSIQAILDLPNKEYLALIEKMLLSSKDGDVIAIAPRDKKIITKKFIDEYAEKNNIKLSLSKEPANILGGIIIMSKDVDKNLSLEVELQSLREQIEPAIASMLFGETK